jgi:hypothetical protein
VANVVFTLGAETFTFSCARAYPVHDPEAVAVVTGLTEGGQMFAYDKGVAEKLWNLEFRALTDTDAANVEQWLTDVAVGPKNTFTFTDEAGAGHTVRLLDTENPLRKTDNNRWSGTLRLREEIA